MAELQATGVPETRVNDFNYLRCELAELADTPGAATPGRTRDR